MAIQGTDNGSTQDRVPVACSLDTDGLRTQSERWHQVLADSGMQRTETDDGLRVRFRADAVTVEELHSLVSVENECCAWASWTVTAAAGSADVVVRSTGDGVAVLHGMLKLPD
jgi:hypothetical protein